MTALAAAAATGRDLGAQIAELRRDFPVLAQQVYGKPLVYFDNAASAQKPRPVLEAMERVLHAEYANVHRGVHRLSAISTEKFEAVRGKVARFLGGAENEIVFTANATDAINLVAQSWGRNFLQPGQAILLTEAEHHANIVPWTLLAAERQLDIRVLPVLDDGRLDMDALPGLLTPDVGLVAVAQISNVLGSINPIARLAEAAHGVGAKLLVDGSQGAVHCPVDVAALGADFYVFTGHKLYGPTGVGVLWARHDILQAMPPWRGGGDMIASVAFDKVTFKDAPYRFEAGTPAIVEVIGLGAAIDYVGQVGWDVIQAQEALLADAARQLLLAEPGMRLIGDAPGKAAIHSFTVDGLHAHDLATILDRAGIAVRVGNHCAEPLMRRFGVGASLRASLAFYNTLDEVERLGRGLRTARTLLQ